MKRYLPSYDPAWSDGCTLSPFLPAQLRRPFQKWMIQCLARDLDVARKMRYACETHDMKYYFGGSVEDREAADKALLQDWKDAGAPYMLRHAAYRAVRMWGGPKWRQQGVSWGYGGTYFQYGLPAIPVPETGRYETVQTHKVRDDTPFEELPYMIVPAWAKATLTPPIWPYKEERCDCAPETVFSSWKDDFDKGVICWGCGRHFTLIRIRPQGGGAS